MSYNEKGEIAILMLYRASVFSVLVKLTDDGSLLEKKVACQSMFTSYLLCVIDN